MRQRQTPSYPIRSPNALGFVLFGLVILGIATGVSAWWMWPLEPVRSWESPDSAYTVTLFRHPRLYAMPGQGSDAPGTLTLTDANGNVLQRTRIEMVQIASDPEWSKDRVRMKLVFDWPLHQNN